MRNLIVLCGVVCLWLPARVYSQDITWSRDVAPILYSNCVKCHNTGGSAPFSLETYEVAFYRSPYIKRMVSEKKMPPWPPVASYRHFVNENALSQGEIDTILSWIDAGAPKGNPEDAPSLPYINNGPVLGKPDLKLTIPPYVSQAYLTDEYACFVIPTGLTTDKYVRAIHIIPGNRSIVHHVIVSLDTTARMTDCMTALIAAQTMYSWASGMTPAVFPNSDDLKMGMRIKKGSNILIQVHYPHGSGGEMDSTSVYLYLYSDNAVTADPPLREVKEDLYLMNWLISFPPNMERDYTARWPCNSLLGCSAPGFIQGPTTSDISLISVDPHMHNLGRRISSFAVTADNDTIPLVKIDDWDYHWQAYYFYPKMVRIPKGSVIYAEAHYDNTTNNLRNPNNPPQLVTAGEQTSNEMFLIAFQYAQYKEGDENYDIQKMIDEAVSATGVPEVQGWQQQPAFDVFPNPAGGRIVLSPLSMMQGKTQITVTDIFSRTVLDMTVPDLHEPLTLNMDETPDGIYLVQLRNNGDCALRKVVVARGR